MDGVFKKCYIHDKGSSLYCKTCRRIICKECSCCEVHVVGAVREMVKNRISSLSSRDHSLSYKDKTEPSIIENEVEYSECVRILETKQTTAKMFGEHVFISGEGRANDHKLMREGIAHIKDIESSAYTNVLKSACQEAIKTLSIKELINLEVDNYTNELRNLNETIEEYKNNVKKLEAERSWLEKIKFIVPERGLDEGEELALSLALENGIIEYFNINCDVYSYVAFPNVDKIFGLGLVEKEALRDIGQGVKMTAPIAVPYSFPKGSYNNCAVSHKGVMAFATYNGGYEGTVIDLRTNYRAIIKLRDHTLFGFYDDYIVMLVYGKPLYECDLEKLSANPTIDSASVMFPGEMARSADLTVMHMTRRLYLLSLGDQIYEFDIDTKQSLNMGFTNKINSMVCLTGINAGVRCVFKENGIHTYALGIDGKLSEVMTYGPGFITYLIPSLARPNDLSASMKFCYNKKVFLGDRTRAIRGTMNYQGDNSLVRLYRDIFLMFDEKIKEWVLLKIIVP